MSVTLASKRCRLDFAVFQTPRPTGLDAAEQVPTAIRYGKRVAQQARLRIDDTSPARPSATAPATHRCSPPAAASGPAKAFRSRCPCVSTRISRNQTSVWPTRIGAACTIATDEMRVPRCDQPAAQQVFAAGWPRSRPTARDGIAWPAAPCPGAPAVRSRACRSPTAAALRPTLAAPSASREPDESVRAQGQADRADREICGKGVRPSTSTGRNARVVLQVELHVLHEPRQVGDDQYRARHRYLRMNARTLELSGRSSSNVPRPKLRNCLRRVISRLTHQSSDDGLLCWASTLTVS